MDAMATIDIKQMNSGRRIFPFTAIVSQDRMKLALILNAVNPAIGGVLVRGEKGTAKSTAVRGLAGLLPDISVVEGCPYQCDPDGGKLCVSCFEMVSSDNAVTRKTIQSPIADLPLGATEDMVLGTIDFEAAVKTGALRFMPGLLARANRGILYVDEVNLLDDHLVEAILDTAESGVNFVEREGISVNHPSVFSLIGTMNPEEGELRPQLLDRFGLAVQVEAESDPALRVELLKRRERFDIDPDGLIKQFSVATNNLRKKIISARILLPRVCMPDHLRTFITEIGMRNHVAGHRADIAIERAACAFAALDGRAEVTSGDITTVVPLALLHRMRNAQELQRNPSSEENSNVRSAASEHCHETSLEKNEKSEKKVESDSSPERSSDVPKPTEGSKEDKREPQQQQMDRELSACREQVHEIGSPFKVRQIEPEKDKVLRSGSGRRSRTRSATKQGRYMKSTLRRGRNDPALDATLRAAAPYQVIRRRNTSGHEVAIHIRESDIREKIRERRIGNVLIFLVDGSGSMGAHRRMVETKAAIMSLLLDAYQKRDKVCMVVFRGTDAKVVLPPTGSVDMAGKLLEQLPVGGRTPLSAGLSAAAGELAKIVRKSPAARPIVLIITDGKANVGFGEDPPHKEALQIAAHMKSLFSTTRFAVIDTEPPGIVRFGLAGYLASALQAQYFHPELLRAEELVKIARENH